MAVAGRLVSAKPTPGISRMFAEITLLSANWFFVSRSSEQDSNVWRSHAVKMSRFEVVSWLSGAHGGNVP